MITGQTIFSVRKGTEHHAETAVAEMVELLRTAEGLRSFSVLRSIGMSPLASGLCDQRREAALCDVHYVVQTTWDDVDDHDAFYAGESMQQIYRSLASILATGPYEILYESIDERVAREGVPV